MSKDNNGIYSHELDDVLNYMVDILVNEFPTDIFTPEYLMVSIFDINNCHANMILDNCLMSNNMEELKEIYISVLKDHSKPLIGETDKTKVQFDFELNKILESAKEEKDKTNAKVVGTEHVLLSILNPKNNIKIREVFNTVGIEYNFILDKCMEETSKRPAQKSIKAKGLINNNGGALKPAIFPLKSEVNATSIIAKDEFISKYAINLNQLVKDGKVDKLIGREKEINEIIRIFARRKKNNVVLVGDGGVGKTQIVQGLASMIVNENVPEILEGKEIVMIDIMSIVSGTNFRGMLEERVKGLFDELKSSKKYILFIDDMQNVLKSGSKDKDTDLSGMIGDILSGGDVRVIGTITPKEYRNCIESNTSLNSKLQKLVVEPSNEKEAFEIISKSKDTYEKYHNVKYTDEAIRKSIEFAERYITDRSLPDSAFDVIDLAGASAAVSAKESEKLIGLKKSLEKIEQDKTNALNEGEFEKIDSLTSEENKINKEIADFKRQQNANNEPHVIDENDIAETISNMTGIPISKLSSTEKKKIAHIDDVLKKYVIGQNEAVDAICKVIKRNKVGLGDKTKTLANIFLCGRSGTGKSYLAKKLAEEVFGDEKALIRIDMSEYSEKNSVSKLLGAAPSYVGFEKGGQLTEAVKNKQHCVLLLDEIEKADEEVYNVFLQLFDEGRLTDSAGQTINFKNVIVLMTSNIGAKQASELGGGVGFNTDESANKKSIIEKALRQRFTPEFLNRLDKIVYFNDLTDDNLKTIVKLEVKKLDNRLNDLHYKLKCDSKVIDLLHKKAIKQKEFGARPIRRLIQDGLEDKITDLMLENDYKPNYEFSAICTNDKIEIK